MLVRRMISFQSRHRRCFGILFAVESLKARRAGECRPLFGFLPTDADPSRLWLFERPECRHPVIIRCPKPAKGGES